MQKLRFFLSLLHINERAKGSKCSHMTFYILPPVCIFEIKKNQTLTLEWISITSNKSTFFNLTMMTSQHAQCRKYLEVDHVPEAL